MQDRRAAWHESEAGQSALVNLALGSVATGVLARCKTPVLLIR